MGQHTNYPLAIHVIFTRNDEILLLRRYNTGYADGFYSLVAGHVEEGESITKAAQREIFEEIGVVVHAKNIHICGSMHRKSEDERIDYFAIASEWEGEIYNAEPNKCDNIIWCPLDSLPPKTIPYIRRAIILTINRRNNSIWYEEFGWNSYNYLQEVKLKHLLYSRNIGNSKNELQKTIESFIAKIYNIDKLLNSEKSDIFIDKLLNYIKEEKIIIGTPIIQNSLSQEPRPLCACAVLPVTVTSSGAIDYNSLKKSLINFSTNGIGIGIDLTNSKYPDKEILQLESLLEDISTTIKQSSHRPIALMLTLSDQHPRVKEFIQARRFKNWDSTKINISICVSDYTNLLYHIDDYVENILASGEPGLLYLDRIASENTTPQWSYVCTAPCAEVALSANEMCHFSYLNLANFVNEDSNCFDFNSFDNGIKLITRLLDDTIELSSKAFEDNSLLLAKRRFGIGIMGFASCLLKLGLKYDSEEGLDFARQILSHLQIESKIESANLAGSRGAFPAYSNSRYADTEWVKTKLSYNILRTRCEFFIHLINNNGIRNTSTVAFPPTGTSSRIACVSQSFEPYSELYEEFQSHRYIPSIIQSAIEKLYPQESGELIAQILRDEVDLIRFPEFVTAKDIPVCYQLEYTRLFQSFSDGSASKTVILNQDATSKDIKDTIIGSYNSNLKGVAIYKLGTVKHIRDEEC